MYTFIYLPRKRHLWKGEVNNNNNTINKTRGKKSLLIAREVIIFYFSCLVLFVLVYKFCHFGSYKKYFWLDNKVHSTRVILKVKTLLLVEYMAIDLHFTVHLSTRSLLYYFICNRSNTNIIGLQVSSCSVDSVDSLIKCNHGNGAGVVNICWKICKRENNKIMKNMCS